MVMRVRWLCTSCRSHLRALVKVQRRSLASVAADGPHHLSKGVEERLKYTRNIGIIAHIDAGKTTTTERMLYYSGFTRRLGDVDEGSTVTDFLPAERARGITIQSAAITFHWPPLPDTATEISKDGQYTINLIDTPGHADFTFEVIRSLRVLDGAICILDGVAGVEAQTEKVWHQASNYRIPRVIYVNKLDRDGAAFNRTIKEIASRLHTWPVLCQIPWWNNGKFVGVGDVINLRGLLWESTGDGFTYKTYEMAELQKSDEQFAAEMLTARVAMIEALTEVDESIVEAFLELNEDYQAVPAKLIKESLRRNLLTKNQSISPVFAGASFRNIGVQPLLDAINDLLPCPLEAPNPDVSIGKVGGTLGKLLAGEMTTTSQSLTKHNAKRSSPPAAAKDSVHVDKLAACALAFKVVSDPKRGVLVYVRVYSGSITRNALLYNTNLAVSERSPRLLRMYASEAVEIQSIDEGQIGVIAGLKHARTGDTLIVYSGANPKTGPPAPLNTLQLRPIDIPPPVFFSSVEPNSLAEEKNLTETMDLLLREDPSLHVNVDEESGQTHLSGMGELHLEIAQGRLIDDFKVKARMGKIQIGYREAITGPSGKITKTFSREIAGKNAEASCSITVSPLDEGPANTENDDHTQHITLSDGNVLTIQHPTLHVNGKPISSDHPSLPVELSLQAVITALANGISAALGRGPTHAFPLHSTHIELTFSPAEHLTPSSTPAALSSAARIAVQAALVASANASPTAVMEPVMQVTIAVSEDALGGVVHDLSSARGAQVLSLDADEEMADANEAIAQRRLTQYQLQRVYAPPDPFGSMTAGGAAGFDAASQQRQIRARVPLKEMVGYLKHLRSQTGGRGTFVMSVDRFERMNAQRTKVALTELRGDFT